MTGEEIVGLYLFLEKHQEDLDPVLLALEDRIQRSLFDQLTIGDIENLQDLYQKKALRLRLLEDAL